MAGIWPSWPGHNKSESPFSKEKSSWHIYCVAAFHAKKIKNTKSRYSKRLGSELNIHSLRKVQKLAQKPITKGHNTLIVAPTASGKTEAALFPILSTLLDEKWPEQSDLRLRT